MEVAVGWVGRGQLLQNQRKDNLKKRQNYKKSKGNEKVTVDINF